MQNLNFPTEINIRNTSTRKLTFNIVKRGIKNELQIKIKRDNVETTKEQLYHNVERKVCQVLKNRFWNRRDKNRPMNQFDLSLSCELTTKKNNQPAIHSSMIEARLKSLPGGD